MTTVVEGRSVASPFWGSGESVVVPTSRYTTAEFTRAENAELWPRVWQTACRLEQIPDVGDYFEYEVAGRSFLIVRSSADEVKAFVNACLHRGTLLKTGCGSAINLTCSFHAWCWNLDGSIDHILSPEDFPGLRDEDLSLPECRVATWGGFVFINPDPDCEPFEDFIRPIDEEVRPYRLEDMRIQRYRTTVLAANWKSVLEQFEELYHSLGTHPQLVPAMDDVGTTYESLGPHSRLILPFGEPSQRVKGLCSEEEALEILIGEARDLGAVAPEHADALDMLLEAGLPEGMTAKDFFINLTKMQIGDQLPDLREDQIMNNWQYSVFPNLIINCMPAQVLVLQMWPNRDDPESCIFHISSLRLYPEYETPPPLTVEVVDDPLRYEGWGRALMQDMLNTPKIQAGMRSRPFIRLAAYQEKAIANRHRVIDQYLERG